MKNIIRIVMALTLAVILLGVSAQTALAAPNTLISEVKGTITAIDKTTTPPTVIITPKDGSAVVVKVDTSTVITKTGTGKITINDLAINDQTTANYNKNTGVAGKITIIQPPEKRRSFEGTIKSKADATLVVTTNKGDETFQVNSKTQYQISGVKNATLDNFKVGDKVIVLTVEVTTGETTTQTAQRMTLIPVKPISVIHEGSVTAYTANASITIQDKKGDSITFIINSDTKISLKKGVTTVNVGDQAIVNGQRDPSESQFTAKTIIDSGAKVVKPAPDVKGTTDASITPDKTSTSTNVSPTTVSFPKPVQKKIIDQMKNKVENNTKNSIKNSVANNKNK